MDHVYVRNTGFYQVSITWFSSFQEKQRQDFVVLLSTAVLSEDTSIMSASLIFPFVWGEKMYILISFSLCQDRLTK